MFRITCVDAGHSHHGAVGGRGLARNQRLQSNNDESRRHHRVCALLATSPQLYIRCSSTSHKALLSSCNKGNPNDCADEGRFEECKASLRNVYLED